MPPAAEHRCDLNWTRVDLAVALAFCAALAAALALRHAERPVAVAGEIPLDDQRIRAATERINPNTADAASLQRLPGIGATRAQAIIAYRRTHGPAPFRAPEDLAAVKGIGPGTVRGIAPHLSLPSSAPTTAPSRAP